MSTFTVGQRVRAVASHAWRIQGGHEYTVVEVIPPCVTPTFTFPEYVTVIDDFGEEICCHTYRFKEIK